MTADVLVPLSGHFLPIDAPAREPQPKASPATSNPKLPTFDSSSGGIPPSSVPPTSSGKVPSEILESLEDGSGGSGAGGTPPPGKGTPGGSAAGSLPGELAPGGDIPEESLGSAPESSAPAEATGEATAETTDDSSSSTAGAILLGLLAGCLLFAFGLVSRRGWMRWRYGL